MTLVSHLTLGKSLLSWPQHPDLQNEWVPLREVTHLFLKIHWYSISNSLYWIPKTHQTVLSSIQRSVWGRLKYLGVDPFGPGLRVLYSSIEVNRQHELRAGLLPGVSMPQPIICLFYLQKRTWLIICFSWDVDLTLQLYQIKNIFDWINSVLLWQERCWFCQPQFIFVIIIQPKSTILGNIALNVLYILLCLNLTAIL